MKQLVVRLDDELVEALDLARSGIPRQRWIREAITTRLAKTRETSAETRETSARKAVTTLTQPKRYVQKPVYKQPSEEDAVARAMTRADAFRRAAQRRRESKPPQNSPV